MTSSPSDSVTPDHIAAAVVALRESSPLVQCLTNAVVTQVTADVLLAVGAAPAMVDNPHEAADFAAVAGAVLVNVGTPTTEMAHAMRLATAAARENGTPWVLDPVAVGALRFRTELAHDLLSNGPHAVRGNASEVLALAGSGAGGRGVDSTDSVDAALEAAVALSRRAGTVVAVSGARDLVVNAGNRRAVWVEGGHPLMQLVIGTGCSLGAVVAAYLAVVPDPMVATVAAHAHLSAAGSVAAETTSAPGSFAVAWKDALHTLSPEEIAGTVSLAVLSLTEEAR